MLTSFKLNIEFQKRLEIAQIYFVFNLYIYFCD